MWRSRVLLATLSSACVLLTPGTWAQENATITGSVVDPTGAVIPNVAITLTNVATGQVRETSSNNSGIYVFSNVGVGHFNLDATALPGCCARRDCLDIVFPVDATALRLHETYSLA
jgi:Carboxypeptidase regulatory-like domain